jgi:hypothetical protein
MKNLKREKIEQEAVASSGEKKEKAIGPSFVSHVWGASRPTYILFTFLFFF